MIVLKNEELTLKLGNFREIRSPLPGAPASNFAFTGHYIHSTNLLLTRNRLYDPETAHWLSKDPLGENGGINLYGYVGNNPVNYWDPLGLAYFAIRPLSSMPGMPPYNRSDDRSNTEILHEQLFFEDEKPSGYREYKYMNIGFGDKGFIVDDEYSNYTIRDGGYNDRVMRSAVIEVNKIWNMNYQLIGHNCQDWTDAVRSKYRELVLKENPQKAKSSLIR